LKYCIDTSGLLSGYNRYYPPEIFFALWVDIDSLIDSGDLISSEVVLQELERGDDDAYRWARRRPKMFLPLDREIQMAVNKILAHPEHSKLVKKDATTTDADPFVIATAMVRGCAVISDEKLMMSPSPNRTKIPNVCRDLNIRHFSFLEFIREQRWRYSQ
jgi:hypothetical protein